MKKTLKNRKSKSLKKNNIKKLYNKTKKATIKALPVVKKELENVGKKITKLTKKSSPSIKKSANILLNKLKLGFNYTKKQAQIGIDNLHNKMMSSSK